MELKQVNIKIKSWSPKSVKTTPNIR